MKNFNPEKNYLVFCHVPKCGGTTLHSFLEELMDGQYVHIHKTSGWEAKIDSVVGAGGHQMNNQNPLFQRENQTPLRMIVLREPLQRYLSFYRHVQDHPRHYLAQRPGVPAMSPSQMATFCVEENIVEFDNLQSRYVAGPNRDHTDLATVLEVFENEFPLFAPLEAMPYFYGKLNRLFGKNTPEPARRNVSSVIDLDPAEVERTAEIVYKSNYNDLQLYLKSVRRLVDEIIPTP